MSRETGAAPKILYRPAFGEIRFMSLAKRVPNSKVALGGDMSGNQWGDYKRAKDKHGQGSPEANAAYNKYVQSMERAGQQGSIKPR